MYTRFYRTILIVTVVHSHQRVIRFRLKISNYNIECGKAIALFYIMTQKEYNKSVRSRSTRIQQRASAFTVLSN